MSLTKSGTMLPGNVAVNFRNNSFSNFAEGAYLVCEPSKSNTTTLLNNDFLQNGLGISNGVGTTFTSLTNVGAVDQCNAESLR